MKYLGATSKILGIEIKRDKSKKYLFISQDTYLKKVLDMFGVSGAKLVTLHISQQFKISNDQIRSLEGDGEFMAEIPCANAIGSLMYTMVYTRVGIAYSVGLMSKFMSNLGKVHWQALKWFLKYIKDLLGKVLVYGFADKNSDISVTLAKRNYSRTQSSRSGYHNTL